jgi:putative flavoprotein involved in K+ transport
METHREAEQVETMIIGGGQAGLAAAYHLRRLGHDPVVLDAFDRIGDAWRTRWDSLRLFTPARYDGLPGWRFPARGWSFPTKDEMADYLEAYAARFELDVRSGVRVDGLGREGHRFLVTSGERRFEADNVIVATGAHRRPKTPAFAAELDPDIVQMHSSEYRSPSQLREGAVLLVGAGNSGAEITREVSRSHPTVLSGRDPGQIPVRHGSLPSRLVVRLMRLVGTHVLTVRTPLGRRVRPKLLSSGTPLIRVKRKDLLAAGVELAPRTIGVRGGLPVLEDGRAVDVANVIWCTGFRSDYGWVDLPIFGEDGRPAQDRGVVAGEPGLYFVGLVFQHSATSDVLPGVGRDAEHVAKHLAARGRSIRSRSDAPARSAA